MSAFLKKPYKEEEQQETTEQNLQTETSEEAKQQTKAAFTQEDINRIVSQTIASERKKADVAVTQAKQEAESLAAMSAEQRAQHLMVERETALKQREQEIQKRENRAEAVQLLQEKGLPQSLADALDYTDADSARIAIEALEVAFRNALQQGIEERMKGMAPNAPKGTAAGFESKLRRAVGIL